MDIFFILLAATLVGLLLIIAQHSLRKSKTENKTEVYYSNRVNRIIFIEKVSDHYKVTIGPNEFTFNEEQKNAFLSRYEKLGDL